MTYLSRPDGPTEAGEVPRTLCHHQVQSQYAILEVSRRRAVVIGPYKLLVTVRMRISRDGAALVRLLSPNQDRAGKQRAGCRECGSQSHL